MNNGIIFMVIVMMIDTHCHLSLNDKDFNNIIDKMRDNIIVCSGASKEDNLNTINIINSYDKVYGTIGFHPDEVDSVESKDLTNLEEALINTKIVGIGEIGLDYYHNKENKEEQKKLFIDQLDLARKHSLPVVIHSREAGEDTLNILKNYSDLKIILHCYSYSLELAKEFLKLGCKFGIGGVLTFKNSKKLVEVVEELPLESFVLETDSPYLTPEPFRGSKNEPYNIIYVAEKIADIKKVNLEEVLEKTTKNACEIYNIRI